MSLFCFCYGKLERLHILYDNWRLARIVEYMRDIKAEALLKVVQKRLSDWNRDFATFHAVVLRHNVLLISAQLRVWHQDYIKEFEPISIRVTRCFWRPFFAGIEAKENP